MVDKNLTPAPNGKEPAFSEEYMDEVMEQVLEQMGGIHGILERRRAFDETHDQFLKDTPRLLELYNNRWVAYFESQLRAYGDTMDEVLKEIDAKGIPRGLSVVEYMTDRPQGHIIVID